jgi:hypothetical protein
MLPAETLACLDYRLVAAARDSPGFRFLGQVGILAGQRLTPILDSGPDTGISAQSCLRGPSQAQGLGCRSREGPWLTLAPPGRPWQSAWTGYPGRLAGQASKKDQVEFCNYIRPPPETVPSPLGRRTPRPCVFGPVIYPATGNRPLSTGPENPQAVCPVPSLSSCPGKSFPLHRARDPGPAGSMSRPRLLQAKPPSPGEKNPGTR